MPLVPPRDPERRPRPGRLSPGSGRESAGGRIAGGLVQAVEMSMKGL